MHGLSVCTGTQDMERHRNGSPAALTRGLEIPSHGKRTPSPQSSPTTKSDGDRNIFASKNAVPSDAKSKRLSLSPRDSLSSIK